MDLNPMRIQMDMQTVFILLVLGHLFTVILITAYKHKQVKDPAVNTFYTAKWLQAATWAMMSVPLITDHILLLTVANILLLLGVSLETKALLTVVGGFNAHARLFYNYFTILAILGYCSIVVFYNTEGFRIAVVSFSTAVFLIPPVRRMIAVSRRSMLRLIIGYMYLVISLGLLCRTIMPWIPIIPVSMFEPGLYQNLSFLTLYLIMMLGNTGFVLLSKERADRELLKLASYDDLTGALNRRSFTLKAQKLLEAKDRKSPASFILLDIDHFKQINDGYGHDAGDRVLENIAFIVSSSLETSSLFGRFGGDEFAILLPESGVEESDVIAERVRRSVESLEIRYGLKASTISMGIVTVPPDQDIPLEELYTTSDLALYRAKQLGRNCAARIDIPLE
ncbi:GGDEF domain-containing protein [Paenibacillus antibioticophila]|uniref:GGDEF domain-containing protein n=3 Tax=Paenibacillus TaxID=44249 RepID=A0A920CE05_9BACL|nr:GGDEF domain-containing protein [Paenibacillus antibioticophila]MBU5671208.1 GGDEF domain-containing protein [Paenibacillus brevis]GIO36431.1 GGDEF domain-containing protein [Paenibacillus antibioticophila]